MFKTSRSDDPRSSVNRIRFGYPLENVFCHHRTFLRALLETAFSPLDIRVREQRIVKGDRLA